MLGDYRCCAVFVRGQNRKFQAAQPEEKVQARKKEGPLFAALYANGYEANGGNCREHFANTY
jgi:hypothetical protein